MEKLHRFQTYHQQLAAQPVAMKIFEIISIGYEAETLFIVDKYIFYRFVTFGAVQSTTCEHVDSGSIQYNISKD